MIEILLAHPFEHSSNSCLNEGDNFLKKMARPGGETSNELFEVLEDWDHQLQHINFDKFEDKPEEPQP